MRLVYLGVFVCCLSLTSCGGGGTDVALGPLKATTIASGLSQPVQYRAVPGFGNLAYVLERPGRVRVLVDDVLQTTPLLDLTSLLNTSGEGGLLGLAFDPDFATNRYIYIYYVGLGNLSRIARYTVSTDGRTSSSSSASMILTYNQAPYSNHKGGTIHFGLDRMLYLALGDGGDSNDPMNRSQDATHLFGKMIRINPNGIDAFPSDIENNYSIPADNPFVGRPTVREEIWSLGWRNPYRWWLDPVNGAQIIADVGQDGFEEINYEPGGRRGRNYGWRVREGKSASSNSGPTYGDILTDPFLDYGRSVGKSITGGFIYRGTDIPELRNRYLFADFISNKIWAVNISLKGDGEADSKTMTDASEITPSTGVSGVTSIDADSQDRIVVCQIGGSVVRLSN
jgi:glucose/arabinose dehydrogenase